MRLKNLFFILIVLCMASSTRSAPPDQNSDKIAVLVCFPTDTVVSNGCQSFSEKLQLAGWKLKVIKVENSQDMGADKIQEMIKTAMPENLPSTAPIVIHGHGETKLESHLIEFFRDRRGNSNSLSSEALLSWIRAQAPRNPIWVSSCHSGSSVFSKDVCTGASCLASEFSYTYLREENTLAVIGDLISDTDQFKRADINHDEMLTPSELKLYFCWRFSLGSKRLIRLTKRKESNDPFKNLYDQTVYLPNDDVLGKYLESFELRANDSKSFSSFRIFKVRQYEIYGDDTKIHNKQLEKMLFESRDDAERWAIKNLSDWPYFGSSSVAQAIGLSKIKRKRTLELALPFENFDTVVEITRPDSSTACRIWNTGQNFPSYVPAGWQTPQFNQFRLYSPSYIPGAVPHSPGNSAIRKTH